MAVRHFLAGQPLTVEACVSHRCDEHQDMPPVNSTGPNLSECAICVGQEFVRAFEEKFWTDLFWPAVESAAARLNFIHPGAGDDFVKETRARVLHARMDPDQTAH